MSQVAYILAASHSGSTLLAMLLNAHPDVCSVGELKATSLGNVDCYRCSCGQPIKKCSFWACVSEAMSRRGLTFDVTNACTHFHAGPTAYTRRLLQPLHRGPLLEWVRDAALHLSPAWRACLPALQRRNQALVECIAEMTRVRVVVDSSKLAMRAKYLLRNEALDMRIVRLVRDGRAVALTYMDPARFADASDPERRGGGMGGNKEAERQSMAQAALAWRRNNEEAEHVLASLNRLRWIEVRYEDLCADPKETLLRVFGFLRVDPAQAVQDFRSVEHHVLGNGMRFDATSEIRLDERWRSVLTKQDLGVFDRVAGKMNRRYGYE